MKRRLVMISVFVFVFTLLPLNYLSADPGNLVKNGDFSDDLDDWSTLGTVNIIIDVTKAAELDSTFGSIIPSQISQYIEVSNKDAILSFDIKQTNYDCGAALTTVGINIFENSIHKGSAWYEYDSLALNTWTSISFKLSELWYDYNGTEMPDFDQIWIFAETYYGDDAIFDNFYLESSKSSEPEEPEIWVRDVDMTCWQVWINEDNNFEFIFWWEYYNNNWVQIYDKEGNLVWEIDFPYGDPRFEAGLPDGMYTVKTFHEAGHMLQEFMIRKP
jgi:hypothetical protein